MQNDLAKDYLFLKIITPYGIKYNDYVQIVNIETTTMGFEGFLKKHIPTVCNVTNGQMLIRDVNGNEKIAVLAGGFLYNNGDILKIFTDYFEFLENVNQAMIEKQKNDLANRLKFEIDQLKIQKLELSLQREIDKLTALKNSYK